MSETAKPEIGTIGWTDLTVPHAEKVRDFYGAVVGGKILSGPKNMGAYGRVCVIQILQARWQRSFSTLD